MVQRLEEAWQILGVPANSDPGQVAEAYRRLARATHPDVSTDPDAAARFATLAWAYRLVSETARAERSERSAGRAQEHGLPRPHPPTAAMAAARIVLNTPSRTCSAIAGWSLLRRAARRSFPPFEIGTRLVPFFGLPVG